MTIRPLQKRDTISPLMILQARTPYESVDKLPISHASDPILLKAIQGHLVAPTAACLASAFCDTAYIAVKYIHEQINPGKAVAVMSIRALDLTHPMTLHSSKSGINLEINAMMHSAETSSVHINSSSSQGPSNTKDGSSKIRVGSSCHWEPEFLRSLHLVHSWMRMLIDPSVANRDHRFLDSIVYNCSPISLIAMSNIEALGKCL